MWVENEGRANEVCYLVSHVDLWIGRGSECAVQFRHDPKVSRQHCRIFGRDGQLVVEDNRSTNSTLVNGDLVSERILTDGDIITVGEHTLRFRRVTS